MSLFFYSNMLVQIAALEVSVYDVYVGTVCVCV